MQHSGGRISLAALRDKVRNATATALKVITHVPRGVIKAVQGVRTGPTQRFQDFLNSPAANTPITAIKLCRKPLASMLTKIANWVSLGSWDRMRQHLQYDQVYHNYLIIVAQTGQVLKVEKNHVVEVHPLSMQDFYYPEGQSVSVALPSGHITIKQMVERASASDPQAFWQYDARNQNCQKFTHDMLTANGMSGPPAFLQPQDAEALVASLGAFNGVPKQVTDLAGRLDRLVWGDGLHAPHRRLIIRNGRARLRA